MPVRQEPSRSPVAPQVHHPAELTRECVGDSADP